MTVIYTDQKKQGGLDETLIQGEAIPTISSPAMRPEVNPLPVAEESKGWFQWKLKPWSWFSGTSTEKADAAKPEIKIGQSEIEKTEDVGASFFSKLKTGVKSAMDHVVQGGINQGLTLAKNIATFGYHPDKADQENIHLLSTLTASQDIPQLLNLSAAKISELIQRKVKIGNYPNSIMQFVEKEEPLIRQLINSALLNIAVNLAKKSAQPSEPLSLSALLDTTVQSVLEPLHDYQTRMAEIEKIEDAKEREIAWNEYLKPAVETLMSLAFPNGADDIVGLNFGKSQLYNFVKETAIPEILSELLRGHSKVHISRKDAEEQLKEAFSGNYAAFDFALSGLKFLSRKVVETLKESLKTDADKLSNALLSESETNPAKKALENLIQSMASDGSSTISSLWNMTALQVETLMMKVLSNSMKKNAGKEPGEAMLHFAGTLAERLSKKTSETTYQALSEELMQESGIDPLNDLPSLLGINAVIAEQLKTKILPEFLKNFHEESTSWMMKKEQNLEALKKLFGTSHSGEACKVIGNYIRCYLPWYLATSHDKAADMLLASLEAQLKKHAGSESEKLIEEINKNKPVLKSFVEKAIQQIGLSESKESGKVWDFVKEYSEAAALEMFLRIAIKIDSLEKESKEPAQASFQTLVSMLKKASEHIDIIDSHENSEGEIQISYSDFGENLHPGIPLDGLPQKEKEGKMAMDFLGVTSKLLHAADLLEGNGIPLPSSVKSGLWDLFKTKGMPNALAEIFESLNQDYTKDALLLGLLKMLNDAIAKGALTPGSGLSKTSQKSAETAKLDSECGEIVKKIIAKLPCSLVKEAFANLDTHDLLPSESIGELIRGFLNQTTLLELVDKAIFAVIPHIHPGKWKGEANEEKFVPKGGSYDFELPKTPKEKAIYEAKKSRKKKIQQKKLIDEGSQALSSQIAQGITGFLQSLWDGFVNTVGKAIPSFKGFIDSIVKSSVVQFILNGFKWIFFPLFKVGGALFKSFVTRPTMKEISNKAHLQEHKNLLYWWRDLLVEMLDHTEQSEKIEFKKEKRLREEKTAEIKKNQDFRKKRALEVALI